MNYTSETLADQRISQESVSTEIGVIESELSQLEIAAFRLMLEWVYG